MAPTVTELGERRTLPFSLEEQLHRVLRLSNLNDPVRLRKNLHKPSYRLTTVKVMGLVVDQVVREGDSPGLPSSNSIGHEDRQSIKKDLINITVRTMILLQQNQQLQKKLNALQNETRALVRSAHGKQGDK